MRRRLFFAIGVLCLSVFAVAIDRHPLLRDVRQHLDLARKCAQSGRIDGALAHAAVVDPDHRLRVRVDCSTIPATDQGLYRNALNGAFRMWEDVLGEKEFEVTECGPYDIMVHFQPNVSDKGIEVCGHSTWTRGVLNPDTHPVPVFSADVWVRMRKPNGEPLTFEQLRACAAHEFGHILGLDDSLDGGLMGKMDFNHPVIAIRPEEVEPLLRARQEAALIRRTFVVHGSK